MKALFLASVAAAVALAGAASAADLKTTPLLKAPPPAPPQASGYVEVYTGWAATQNITTDVFPFFASVDDDKLRGWPLGGAGRASYWFTPNTSVQIDAQAEGTSYGREGIEPGHLSTLSYLVAAHLNVRDSNMGLLGLFGGAGDAGGSGLSSSLRHGVFGGEGQLYWNQLTLYAQGGYDRTVTADFGTDNVHAWFARGTGRLFIDPNLMIEATGLYAGGGIDFTSTTFLASAGINSRAFRTWEWLAKIEWRPAMMPFSLFVKYEASKTSFDDLTPPFTVLSQSTTDNRFLAGVRLYAGQVSLQANDRSGTTLDILDPLGLASSPVMFGSFQSGVLFSDIRLKHDIIPLGRLSNGLGLYRYRYLWSDTVYIGVMAQEVAEAYPDSVVRGSDGYLRVDYRSLGLQLRTLSEWNALTYGTGLQHPAIEGL
jgi:opacity protein-like surface antigen